MCCSHNGEIHWQHVERKVGKASPVFRKRRNKEVRYPNDIFLLFASQHQNGFSGIKMLGAFEDSLQHLLTDRDRAVFWHRAFEAFPHLSAFRSVAIEMESYPLLSFSRALYSSILKRWLQSRIRNIVSILEFQDTQLRLFLNNPILNTKLIKIFL
jgi:hypothetical protein